jgi:hypothetical protein
MMQYASREDALASGPTGWGRYRPSQRNGRPITGR